MMKLFDLIAKVLDQYSDIFLVDFTLPTNDPFEAYNILIKKYIINLWYKFTTCRKVYNIIVDQMNT